MFTSEALQCPSPFWQFRPEKGRVGSDSALLPDQRIPAQFQSNSIQSNSSQAPRQHLCSSSSRSHWHITISFLTRALGIHLYSLGRELLGLPLSFLVPILPWGSIVKQDHRPSICMSELKPSPRLCISSLTISLLLSLWHCHTAPPTLSLMS